jgi:hypothetical protein
MHLEIICLILPESILEELVVIMLGGRSSSEDEKIDGIHDE